MGADWELHFGQKTCTAIPDGLFGQNLEITRSTMFGGLSAQLINNRKFYAEDGEAFARGWSPVGKCGMAENGRRRCPVLHLGSEPAGVVQEAEQMKLRPKAEYRWRLRWKGNFRAKIRIQLGSAVAEAYCSSDGAPAVIEGNLSVQAREDGGKLSILAVGEGEMLLENASLLPADAILCGLRPDVIAQLKMLKPHSLRFPGGCYAEFFDWKQGLLEPDARGIISVNGMDFLLGSTWNQDPQDMSLDDFVAVCRMVDAQPQYTVRMTGATGEDAAALVEYANGSAETRWGAVRAARGFKEPYGIRRWYVGNEIYPFVPGMKDPKAAAAKTVELAKAMKQADPSIELVPSNWALSEWNAAFLAEIERLGGAELFERASYHQYLLDILQDCEDKLAVEKTPDQGLLDHVEACLRAPAERILPRMRAVRRELQSAGAGVGALPVTMDEWNYFWGRTGHPVLALFMAGLFHVLIRNGAEVGIREAMYFHPINEGILRVLDDGVALEDGAHAWLMARLHAGRSVLPIENPKTDSPCDAAASAEGNTVYVTLVNRSLSEACNVTIPELASASAVRTECWRMEKIEDCFRAGSMRPHLLTHDAAGTLALPPASMAGVWFEKGERG